MGQRILKLPQSIIGVGLRLTLAEISKMADALRISNSVFFSDCKCSFRLQKIELIITWNFNKLGIPIQFKIKQWK